MAEPVATPRAGLPDPADTIDLGTRVVPGGFFVTRPDVPTRTPFVPARAGADHAYRHCFTYAGGGSTIQDELVAMIDGAREKVFVATLYLGDAAVREALVRAAHRLRGGVYVVAALDNKGLDKAINETDDLTDVDKQIEYRNFKEITTQGIYVRGHPGLHAKYVVVDDAVALVSSANLATRAFHRTGENGVVVTAPLDVRGLATLFARLWARSRFDLPPNRTESAVGKRDPGRAPRLPDGTGNGPVWTYEQATTVLAAMREVIDGARSDLVLATYSLLGIAHRLSADKPARPELLLDPVRAAAGRGVDVRLLLRGRNIGDATRREATSFADSGVRIVPDRLNHAKGVIADETRGALFSANFVPHLGLLEGIEVGMRLDHTPALVEASRYFEHAMAEADLEFVRDPTAAELDTGMYADSFTTWPHRAPLAVTASPADWSALAADTDFALYEAESAQRLTIHCARRRWQLVRKDDRWVIDSASSAGQSTTDTLEKWLAPRYRSTVRRGFCPAVLRRVET
jgi:phosphatidylserine/phosphatidylglycerophosphate/cardiolipin synthase-like enzyme